MVNKKLSYLEMPCERCGSDKEISKPKTEKMQNSFGESDVEVSKIVCTNVECQKEFDRQRSIELVALNNRKLEREERNRERRGNIAKTIAERKEFKFSDK